MKTTMIRNARMDSLSRAAARLAALLLAVPILSLAASTAAAAEEDSDRYAGTYKIDDWRSLEKKSISHMFVLERDGRFLLGAQWSDKEENYFFGTWTLADGKSHSTASARCGPTRGAGRPGSRAPIRSERKTAGSS
ncbi:MAG: hypothetical protein IIA41_02955 [SAR324 cluster bacterium]|nr:hypothetical protein [SAR324 cluster bacterium]